MPEKLNGNDTPKIDEYLSDLDVETARLQKYISENMREMQKSISFFERGLTLRLMTVNRRGRDDKKVIYDDGPASFLSQQIGLFKSIYEAQEECLIALRGLADDLVDMHNPDTKH